MHKHKQVQRPPACGRSKKKIQKTEEKKNREGKTQEEAKCKDSTSKRNVLRIPAAIKALSSHRLPAAVCALNVTCFCNSFWFRLVSLALFLFYSSAPAPASALTQCLLHRS